MKAHTVETEGKQVKQNTEKGANKYLSRAQFVECESGMNGKKTTATFGWPKNAAATGETRQR